jgi:hypothetical protein
MATTLLLETFVHELDVETPEFFVNVSLFIIKESNMNFIDLIFQLSSLNLLWSLAFYQCIGERVVTCLHSIRIDSPTGVGPLDFTLTIAQVLGQLDFTLTWWALVLVVVAIGDDLCRVLRWQVEEDM